MELEKNKRHNTRKAMIMAEENNWAAVLRNEQGIWLYHNTDAAAQTGWKEVPEAYLDKYNIIG